MTQRLCVLQHADGEGLGSMHQWFAEKGFTINIIRIDRGEPLPPIDSFDWLVLMGGPMGVYEEVQYPWLAAEKEWLRKAIEADKKVLGVCLGAQLIASALDAAVYPSDTVEIGWHPIYRTDSSASWLPEQACLLSWHGDRLELPENAKAFAANEVTPCQGFSYGDRVWALQFHIEAEAGTVDTFLEAGGGYLPQGEFVQSIEQLENTEHLAASAKTATGLLDFMAAR